ncbi:hypothetical protein LTR70_000001 [Exophiala xenobiotica]|uniref:5'-3' DNA helicase ZGRF1-like N-terminal domain-containing protein n=1 Tax=Lithohypha guttulata TaxID=1690604 RepID=A0ABR0K4V5_9EURO|nr:hypothetical protein LTR24_006933 [Lithohypha guttulata]KAK5330679.1 hypothetical protein LTR70_000001 [Exophiala xenobiotica]
MAMATAIHRSTPASILTQNASQSQLSAPVLEFRCMFTHDIFKKSKKWHDGSLRYHTFNKRVMVYDDTKNLVGDLHYRQAEDFAEGLELKLDRPVLVHVEEPLDLTQLLGRQRQDLNNQPVNQTQPTRASLARINAANSQARPKSIKELLGASQGRLGRASLPIQLPFEQRQALADIQPTIQPSPKRRKISTRNENEPTIVPAQAAPVRPSPVATPSVPLKPVQLAGPVVDISSDDGPSTRHIPRMTNNSMRPSREKGPRMPKPLPAAKPAEPRARSRTNSDDTLSVNKGRISKKQKQKKPLSDDHVDEGLTEPVSRQRDNPSIGNDTPSAASKPLPPSRPRSSSAASIQSQRRFSSGPRSSLKFASQRPRPKLIYKALLTPTPTQAPVHDFQASSTEHPESPPARQRRTELLDTESFFDASQIAGEPAAAVKQPPGSFLPDTEQAEDGPTAADDNLSDRSQEHAPSEDVSSYSPAVDGNADKGPDSPLFMPRTASQISPMPSRNFNTDDVPFQRLSQEASRPMSSSSVSSVEKSHEQMGPVYPQSPTNPGKHKEEQSSPTFVAAVSKPAQRTGTNEAAASEHVVVSNLEPINSQSRSALPFAVSRSLAKVKGRLFRRVVSEQLPMDTSTCDNFLMDSHLDGDLNLLEDSPVRLTPAKVARDAAPVPPAKLQRATSDPVTLDSTLAMHYPDSSSPTGEADAQSPPHEVQPQPVPTAALSPVAPLPVADAGPWTTTEAFLLFDWWPPGKQKPDYGQDTQAGPNGIGAIEDSASVAMKAVANKKYGVFGSARLVSQR